MILLIVGFLGGIVAAAWLWLWPGWQRGATAVVAWLVLMLALGSFLYSRSRPDDRRKLDDGAWIARQLVLLDDRVRIEKLLFGIAAIAILSLFLIWRQHALKTPLSLALVVAWVFFIAAGMLIIGSRQFDKLHNQVGLALVSGLVLALAALVVNLAVEEALVSSARDRREADTKLAINRRDQWIFRSEDLEGFRFSGMSFTRLVDEDPFDFSYAAMDDIELENADLRKAVLRDAQLNRAEMLGANLGEADLSRAVMGGAHLESSNLSKARLVRAQLQGASFEGADLRRADLSGAALRDAVMVGADLSEANLAGADLEGADLSGANLTGADVTADQLGEGKVDDATTCPNGAPAARRGDEAGEADCGDKTGDPGAVKPVEAILEIKPTTPIGVPVGRIARTGDEGQPVMFELEDICETSRASCLDPAGWPLSVGAADGLIRVTASLESEAAYTVTVRITPPGTADSETADDLPVCDPKDAASDEPCIFPFDVLGGQKDPIETSLEFLVRADAEAGTPVARIDLVSDEPVLTTGSDKFRIDRAGSEWVVVVDGVLDADTTYEVVVQSGPDVESPQTVRMVISVFSRNDPPEIVVPPEPTEVSRMALVGDIVAVVEASDPNEDDVLVYTIVSTERAIGGCEGAAPFSPVDPSHQAFSIDASTGELAVQTSLITLPGCHRIAIEVRDNAVDSRSRRAELMLDVTIDWPVPDNPGLLWVF